MAAKIKKGDKVIVSAGNEKGKTGIVKSVFPAEGRAIIEGVNVTQRFKKTFSGESSSSVERSVHLSNLQCVDSAGKGGKVAFKLNSEGVKVRYFKKSGEILDV